MTVERALWIQRWRLLFALVYSGSPRYLESLVRVLSKHFVLPAQQASTHSVPGHPASPVVTLFFDCHFLLKNKS